MGGYAALIARCFLKRKSIVAECPQIDLEKYSDSFRYLYQKKNIVFNNYNVFTFLRNKYLNINIF